MGLFENVDWGDIATGAEGVSEALSTWTGSGDDDDGSTSVTVTTTAVPVTEQEWFWPVMLIGGGRIVVLAMRR